MTTVVRQLEVADVSRRAADHRRRFKLVGALVAVNAALLGFLVVDGTDDRLAEPVRMAALIDAAGSDRTGHATSESPTRTALPPLIITGSVATTDDADVLLRHAKELFHDAEIDGHISVSDSPSTAKHALLRVRANEVFEPGSADFADGADRLIAAIAELVTSVETIPLHVIAHSDRPRTLAGSLALTEQQAQALIVRLSDLGVIPHRMAAFGRGNQEPFVDVNRTTRMPERIDIVFVRALEPSEQSD